MTRAGGADTRPRLLDLFCGAGGATRGYQMAGFHVTGVDIEPQPRYVGDEFHQADALTFPLDGFDAIHASPPCQDHTTVRTAQEPDGSGWMLAATIERLRAWGGPYVIENVMGAATEMPGAFMLCGESFGLRRLCRHRLFLSNVMMLVPPRACRRSPVGVYGDLAKNDRSMGTRSDGYHRGVRAGVQTARELLGCSWMSADEITQAIPPAYTRFIGEWLLAHIGAAVSP